MKKLFLLALCCMSLNPRQDKISVKELSLLGGAGLFLGYSIYFAQEAKNINSTETPERLEEYPKAAVLCGIISLICAFFSVKTVLKLYDNSINSYQGSWNYSKNPLTVPSISG